MSSVVRHIHYKPELEELSVWLGPQRRRYKYFGVPQAFYDALREAPSRGGFYNQFIRGHFPSHLVEVAKPARHRPAIRSAS